MAAWHSGRSYPRYESTCPSLPSETTLLSSIPLHEPPTAYIPRMPPGKNIDTLLTQLRSGLWRLHYQLSPEGRTRFFKEFLPVLHDTKTEVLGARDPHAWYLVYLGTKIESREKGYARKVVEYVTSMADREGRACYLESSNEINPVIYRKLGFVGVRRVGLCRAKGRVELEVMIREPVREGEVD